MKNKFIKSHVTGINDLDSYFNLPEIQKDTKNLVKNWKTQKYKKEEGE